MATGTDRLPNYEQMERLIAATEVATPAQVRIPVQVDHEFTYDGTAHTVRFDDLDTGRAMITNATNIEPGRYIATAYLRSIADKWTDGSTGAKNYIYAILPGDAGSTSWENAADEKIDEILTAAEAGEVDLARDYGWQVGDERVITLGAIAASGGSGSDTYTVGESHIKQPAVLVLMDTDHYELASPTSGGRTRSEFVVGLKYVMQIGGYMNATSTNAGSWEASARRAWCNIGFRAAMPEYLRKHFKQFHVDTAQEYNSSVIKESTDYFSLFGEYEIFGAKTYSPEVETTALTQVEYYKTAANRIKSSISGVSGTYWWLRSPGSGSTNGFCGVAGGGAAGNGSAPASIGLAPFGCL